MITTPTYQLFKPLPTAVEAALRASIIRFGVLVPVVKDQHGEIIDGHHRARIAAELRMDYRVDRVTVASPAEAREMATTLNADRRHLTEEQRKEVVALLAAETVAVGQEEVAKHSPEAIAGALGVTDTTIRRDIAELERASQLSRPGKQVGLDGKVRSTSASPKKSGPPPVRKRDGRTSRRPLPALAGEAGWKLRRDVEAIEKIFADDRFGENKSKVAGHLHGHLTYAIETLRGLLDRIDATGEV